MNPLILRIFLLFILSDPAFAVARHYNEAGIGAMADNVLQPVSVFSSFMRAACFVLGGSFLFASLIRYFEHRRSPLMVTMATVVFMFVMGVIFLLLPFIPNIIDAAG